MAVTATLTDLQMANDGLRLALRRAAGAIQGMYIGSGRKGITGEASIALAYALQESGESWDAAVERAQKELARDWPHALTT